MAKATYLSVRTGHYVVPKILEGRPVDKLSPLMKKLSVEQRRPLLTLMLKLVHGDMTAYGLPAPPYKPGQGPLISSSEFLPAIVHHELFHMIESAQPAGMEVHDPEWERANPAGFSYDAGPSASFT